MENNEKITIVCDPVMGGFFVVSEKEQQKIIKEIEEKLNKKYEETKI